MKRFLIALVLTFLATTALAAPPPFIFATNPALLLPSGCSNGQIATYTAATNRWSCSAAGTGDLLADGSVPLTANWDVGAFTITAAAFIPDTAANAAGEIGYTGGAFSWFATSEDLALTATENLWTFSSSTGATFAFTPQVTFTANPRIYDGSHYLTIDADGLTGDATITFGANTNNLAIKNGTGVLDIAAGATLNIDTSLQVATAPVVIHGKTGFSSTLGLPLALSLDGTLTDGKACTYTADGTIIHCNSTFLAPDGDGSSLTGICTPTEIDGHAAASPTAAQLKACNATTIHNYNQAAADVNITLPAVAANLKFKANVSTAQAANYWRFTSAAGGDMYLDGSTTGKNYIQFATPVAGYHFECFTANIGNTYKWLCESKVGTLTTN